MCSKDLILTLLPIHLSLTFATMHPLLQHIGKITGARDLDEAEILSYFEPRAYRKKEILQQEDKPCLFYFFVLKGCLRLYFIDDSGAEQTLQFALENWWMTDLDAFRSGRFSAYHIQALELTDVLMISAANYTLLLEKVPVMEKYFRLVYERAYAASLLRVRLISRMPKEQFFNLFENKYPEFIQRIPQKILASFLGFSPEYLSELRKKRLVKQNK